MAVSMGMVTIAAGVNTPFEISQGFGGVLLSNESGLRVLVTFEGAAGQSRILSAGMADFFAMPKGFNGNIILSPSAQLSNVASWPSSYIDVEAFGPGERPSGTYPAALVRATNNGNVINTNAVSNTLSNEINGINSEVIDIGTIANQKLWDIFTDHFTISIEIGGVVHTILQGKLTGSPALLGMLNDIAEFLGKVQIDQDLNFSGLAPNIDASAATSRLQFKFNGTSIMQVTANGLNFNAGAGITSPFASTNRLGSNNICSASHFSGTGSGTYNHNFANGTPNFIGITDSQASSSMTVGATITSTQAAVTCGAAHTFNGFATQV